MAAAFKFVWLTEFDGTRPFMVCVHSETPVVSIREARADMNPGDREIRCRSVVLLTPAGAREYLVGETTEQIREKVFGNPFPHARGHLERGPRPGG